MENESLKNMPEVKNRILSFIRIRGPSLPVHISREIKTSMLFASAFLSELISERKIKTSDMRVGGSPLYLLPDQENMLENFHNFLPGKEKEAFLLLKEKRVLEDDKMLPAIRVALRSIKDFAKPFSLENKIFWRFFTLDEKEAFELVKPKEEKPKEEKPREEKEKIELIIEKKPEKAREVQEKIEVKEEVKELKKEKEKLTKEKPLLEIKEKPKEKTRIKVKKPREKSNFVLRVLESIRRKDIELIEELEHKKRELTAKVRINSEIGKIEFLSIAKDKKRITENDLALLLQKAQSMKLPALLITTGKPDKKALAYLENWQNMIKLIELSLLP